MPIPEKYLYLVSVFFLLLFLSCSSDSPNCGEYNGGIGLYTQEDVDDFAKCGYTSIEGTLFISDEAPVGNVGSVIKDLRGLSSLTYVSGDILIRDAEGITSLDGLDNIESCGSLEIVKCINLTNTDGLRKLKPKGGVYIQYNFKLERLSGFHFDNNSTTGIVISFCPLIKDIDVFKGVTKSHAVIIVGNSSLENIEGLRDVKVIGENNITTSFEVLEIRNNDRLESLDPLGNVTTIDYGGIEIENNPLILDLDGLSSLTDFKGNILILNNNNLLNIDGLANLTEVEKLRISGNYNLQSINGLGNMNLVRRKLRISANTSLADFCGIENLVNNGMICCGYQAYIVSGNAFNPSQQDIIDGNCSQ
jgi:hypothetical protein